MSAITFAGALAQWWQDHRMSLSDTTIYTADESLRIHILPALGAMSIDAVTPEVLRQYIADKLAHGSPKRHPGGLSSSTIRDHFKLIRPALAWAVEHNYLQDNPANRIKLPRIIRREVQTFTGCELAALIDVARPHWMGDLIILAARTGLRRGECFGLKWVDVDLEGQYLLVRRSVAAKAPGERRIHVPKTARSCRRVALDSKAMAMLQRRKTQAKSEWVFEGRGGCLLSPWQVTQYMREACDAAGIPRRCFHTLRHTHATVLLAAGVNPKVVQERLGHADLQITLGTYGHVLPTMQAEAIRVLNDL